MQKDEVMNLFWYLEIDVDDAEMFFKMLEKAGGGGAITLDDFISNCLKLKGLASSLDVALLGFDLKLMRREIAELRTVSRGGSACSRMLQSDHRNDGAHAN